MLSLEYIAGFFDGEGCLTFLRHPKCQAIGVTASITNNDRRVLDEVKARYGGCVYTRHRRNEANRKVTYCWSVAGEKAVRFLRALEPYLVIKRPQAQVAFFWQKVRPGQGRRIPWNIVHRELIEDDLRNLNHRGKRIVGA